MQNNFDSPMSMRVRRQRSVEMSIVLGLLGIFFVLLGYGVQASQNVSSQDLEFLSDGQLYRTSYHFQPPRNWMNGSSNYLIIIYYVLTFNLVILFLIVFFLVDFSLYFLFSGLFCFPINDDG